MTTSFPPLQKHAQIFAPDFLGVAPSIHPSHAPMSAPLVTSNFRKKKVVSDSSFENNANKRWKRENDSSTVVAHSSDTSNWSTYPSPIHVPNSSSNDYNEGMYVFQTELNPIVERYSTAAIYYNVGQTHIARKQFVEAKHWFEMALNQVFSSFLQTYAMEMDEDANISLIRIHHNCGYCLYQMGQMKDAMLSYEKALSIITNRLGQMQFQQQSSKRLVQYREYQALTENCIAVLLFYIQQPIDTFSLSAMSLFLQSLSILEGINGKNSQRMETILNQIGRLHFQDPKFALDAYRRSRDIRGGEKALLDVAANVCNVAQAYHQCGEHQKALDHYLQYLSIKEPLLGSFHLDVACIYHRIGELYHTQLQHDPAKRWYLKALSSFKMILGASHSLVAVVLSHLGSLHVEIDDFDTALLYHSEALQIKQSHLQWNDPQIAEALTNVAHVHAKLGNSKEALIFYDQVQVLQIEIFGSNSLEVAATLSSTAQLHYHQRNYDTAFELYQQVLTIHRDHKEDQTTAVANTFSMMGLVLFQKGELEMAKTCFLDSLRISLPLLGPDHADVAIIWYNLASIFLKCGDEGTSITLYSESLRIERLAFNPKDESTYGITVTLQHLAVVCQRNGEFNSAINYLSEALLFERSKETKNAQSIGQFLNLLGNIHLQTGDVASMMSCFVEASRIFTELNDPAETVAVTGLPLYTVSKLHPPCSPVA
jgi:tetratricopeptide (TPR) repeat protein